jgi:hypothetical protein
VAGSRLLFPPREFHVVWTGKVERIQGVRHRRQVFSRNMQVDGRVFKFGMAELNLDGAQICSGFEQVRSETVASIPAPE